MYTNDNKLVIDVVNNIKIYHFINNESIDVEINLKKEDVKVDYYLGIINKTNNKCNVVINHNKSKTESNVVLHGINILDNKLTFEVSAKVEKEASKCICKQDNKIINLSDGVGVILPKLFIRNYDTESSHSAYISTCSKEELFYLEKMGISESLGKELLMKSFIIKDARTSEKIVLDILKEIEEVKNG